MDKPLSLDKQTVSSCKLPRKNEAIEALLSLAWMKRRKDRPKWLIDELSTY